MKTRETKQTFSEGGDQGERPLILIRGSGVYVTAGFRRGGRRGPLAGRTHSCVSPGI